YAQEFKKLVASRPWCEHAGVVDHDALGEWLGRAALLIMPSLEENCPMVVLEAMAAGVPVLSADVGGIRDLLDGSEFGMLFTPTEPDSIRTAITHALEHRITADAMAQKAQRVARERFHPAVIAAD